jgi:hypothetical protein
MIPGKDKQQIHEQISAFVSINDDNGHQFSLTPLTALSPRLRTAHWSLAALPTVAVMSRFVVLSK